MRKSIRFIILIVLFQACIENDFIDNFVPPVVKIQQTIDSLQVGNTFQLSATFFDNVGKESDLQIEWTSDQPAIAMVNSDGLLSALSPGTTTITGAVQFENERFTDSFEVVAGAKTVLTDNGDSRGGSIATTSSYRLEGDFTLTLEGAQLKLSFADNYKASTALPGLYAYLTNNPSTIDGAYEIGAVQVFNGAHEYLIDTTDVKLDQYAYLLYFCKPFRVKVGDGAIQ